MEFLKNSRHFSEAWIYITRIYIYIHICTHILYICVCIYKIYIHIYICMCVHIYIYISVCIHTYTHTYTLNAVNVYIYICGMEMIFSAIEESCCECFQTLSHRVACNISAESPVTVY